MKKFILLMTYFAIVAFGLTCCNRIDSGEVLGEDVWVSYEIETDSGYAPTKNDHVGFALEKEINGIVIFFVSDGDIVKEFWGKYEIEGNKVVAKSVVNKDDFVAIVIDNIIDSKHIEGTLVTGGQETKIKLKKK